MLWWFSQEKAGIEGQPSNQMITFREAIVHVMRLRNVWILSIATAGVSGCVNGMLGFLPLYLRDSGWEPAIADSTLASFHAVSMLFAPPVGNWLAKFGADLPFLFRAALLFLGSTGWLFMRPTAAENTSSTQAKTRNGIFELPG